VKKSEFNLLVENWRKFLKDSVIKENVSNQSKSDDADYLQQPEFEFYKLGVDLGMDLSGEKGTKYTKCYRVQVNYQLAIRKKEFELQFYVEALAGVSNKESLKRTEEDKSKIENLIKTVAKECGFGRQSRSPLTKSHIIEFNAYNTDDAKKLKECLDKIKEIIVETSLLPELSTPADVSNAFEYVISRYLNESMKMSLDNYINKIINKNFKEIIENFKLSRKKLAGFKKAYKKLYNIKLDNDSFGEAIEAGLKKYMQSEINKKTK
tara:strand:+ start:362 stop:1156 length:795 start_codon:yes stop_codon:yes gene_type:complete